MLYTSALAGTPLGASLSHANLLSNAQRDHVERVVSQAGGNKTTAARMLGIGKTTMYRKLKEMSGKPRS